MKKIEIYNRDTNETYAIIETRKKDVQQVVINYLKDNNFRIILQGVVKPNVSDLYWLAHNTITKEDLKLWYREQEKQQEKVQYETEHEVVEEVER